MTKQSYQNDTQTAAKSSAGDGMRWVRHVCRTHQPYVPMQILRRMVHKHNSPHGAFGRSETANHRLTIHLSGFNVPQVCRKSGQAFDLCNSFKGKQKSEASVASVCSVPSKTSPSSPGIAPESSLACHSSRICPSHSLKPSLLPETTH